MKLVKLEFNRYKHPRFYEVMVYQIYTCVSGYYLEVVDWEPDIRDETVWFDLKAKMNAND